MRIPVKKSTSLLGIAAVAASLTLVGCGGDDDGGGSDSNTVTIWSSVDQPVQDGLLKALEAKIDAGGDDITVDWQKVDNINQLIMTKIQANDTPDIAFIPQPGVVSDIVSRGAAQPLDDVVDMSALRSNMVPGSLEAGTVDDQLYGLLVSANVKGLVFYNKPEWESAGYPTEVASIDDLNALTEQIKADGNTPWCMGIESDTATGWPATDWFETLIAKYNGVDGYNEWVTHEIPFDSDEVRQAADEFETLLFTDGNVLGGRDAIASTNFGTAGNPMFDDGGPSCWMYNQGSFITGFFPKDDPRRPRRQRGRVRLPARRSRRRQPRHRRRRPGHAAQRERERQDRACSTCRRPTSATTPRRRSSFISPHKDFNLALYPNETDQDHRRGGLRVHGVPVRRLRPDARRGRRRHLLAGHDRLDQRPGGPRHRTEEHRRQLARQLT